MGSNHSEGEAHHHVIDIPNERLASMQRKISENPKLLSKAAGKGSCSIFRVPQILSEANTKAYQPGIVSIGPYHRGQPRLNMIEEHKWRYLGSLLSRTQLALEDLWESIAPLENKARECYSETIQLDSHEFIEMMVLDGCFIIELFRKVARLVPFETDDPLETMAWIFPPFCRDFLKLENQIPFFILQRLFELSKSKSPEEKSKSTPTLFTLAMEFFNNSFQRPNEVIIAITKRRDEVKGHHLLDLVRSSFIPSDIEETEKQTVATQTHVIHCVSKLRRAGIKINKGKDSDSFLHVTFSNGEIEMPTITMDGVMGSFLLNCVAFEQCYSGCSMHFTTYVALLDCLINTYRDVGYLCDRNIIENYLGKEGDVAQFINNAGKDVAVDLDSCYLSKVFIDVREYYGSSWHVHWASFKYTYFDTPWSFISALAAFVLLVLTVAQTFFAAYQYFDPKNS